MSFTSALIKHNSSDSIILKYTVNIVENICEKYRAVLEELPISDAPFDIVLDRDVTFLVGRKQGRVFHSYKVIAINATELAELSFIEKNTERSAYRIKQARKIDISQIDEEYAGQMDLYIKFNSNLNLIYGYLYTLFSKLNDHGMLDTMAKDFSQVSDFNFHKYHSLVSENGLSSLNLSFNPNEVNEIKSIMNILISPIVRQKLAEIQLSLDLM